jgi:hypothetical protein
VVRVQRLGGTLERADVEHSTPSANTMPKQMQPLGTWWPKPPAISTTPTTSRNESARILIVE